MNVEEVKNAHRLFDKGETSKLYKYIKPFLEKGDPYAFYFYARFSLSEWEETEDEYDKRYIELLTKAANANVVEAMHQISALYFTGDTVTKDIEVGKTYLNKAYELNYGPAKVTLGASHYYGANGYQKDLEKAKELVTQAEREDVEGADELLKIMNEK